MLTADVARAAVREVGAHRVMVVVIGGGPRHGALGANGARIVTDAITQATRLGIPIVFDVDSSGADVHEGVAALHGWGRIAKALADASGVVPTVLAIRGVCLSGPALLAGIADIVVMATDAITYVSGPAAAYEVTGVACTADELGGAALHDVRSGVASMAVADDDLMDAVGQVLQFLGANSLCDPARVASADPTDRPSTNAATLVPAEPTRAYDVRRVIADVVDDGEYCELKARHAPNVVTLFARLDGRAVGVVANQPCQRAGTLDIDASRKAARFVRMCDAFNVPIVTFVDTPGFEPGRDLEWSGIIRHGAQLVYAYCEATVPRLCVVLRKAYGGAYIVMDSRGIGNDLCVAWPGAEIAVMGTSGALQILGSKGLTAPEYEARFMNPYQAAERGYVDAVIDPTETRSMLCAALDTLSAKRTPVTAPRRHGNMSL